MLDDSKHIYLCGTKDAKLSKSMCSRSIMEQNGPNYCDVPAHDLLLYFGSIRFGWGSKQGRIKRSLNALRHHHRRASAFLMSATRYGRSEDGYTQIHAPQQ